MNNNSSILAFEAVYVKDGKDLRGSFRDDLVHTIPYFHVISVFSVIPLSSISLSFPPPSSSATVISGEEDIRKRNATSEKLTEICLCIAIVLDCHRESSW